MKNLLYIYLVIGIFTSLNSSAQTSGIGHITSIELKVATYESNQAKIVQNKAELANLEILWKNKIQKLKDELSAFYKERDNLIADMKVGAKCSQCGKYKSEFEKEGKSFQQHLGEVKGYAIPATTTELETTRKTFAEKIAIRKVQIQNLEKGDNALNKKQSDINTLENENEKLCKEITQYSKNYETTVLAEAKAKQDRWISELMDYATNILIADDKITIYKARIIQYEQDFQKESELIKEKVKKENLEAQNQKNVQITDNQQKIKEIQIKQANYIAPLEIKLNTLKEQKDNIEKELLSLAIADSTKVTLTASLNQLIAQITSLGKNILDHSTNAKNRITSLENENNKLKDEVYQLSINLSKQQAQEIAKIKPIYDKKKVVASQSVTTSTAELFNARKLYAEKADFYKKQNQLYVDEVISESNRMINAGQKVSCPIWNEARFKVMGNWNQVFPCINTLTTMTKPYNTSVFNSYCLGKSATSYMALYKSFLVSLSEEDKEAVKKNGNVSWFELITQ